MNVRTLKLAIATVMVAGSVIGMMTSVWPWRLFADSEPVVVLTLSWLALLFAGLDGLLIVSEDK